MIASTGPGYCLKPPNNSMISEYIDRVAQQVLHSKVDVKSIVLEQFKSVTTEMSPMESLATACRLISKRLVHDNLTLRKQMVGEFIQTIRSIQQQSVEDTTFEDGLHTNTVNLTLLRLHTRYHLHQKLLLLTMIIGV